MPRLSKSLQQPLLDPDVGSSVVIEVPMDNVLSDDILNDILLHLLKTDPYMIKVLLRVNKAINCGIKASLEQSPELKASYEAAKSTPANSIVESTLFQKCYPYISKILNIAYFPSVFLLAFCMMAVFISIDYLVTFGFNLEFERAQHRFTNGSNINNGTRCGDNITLSSNKTTNCQMDLLRIDSFLGFCIVGGGFSLVMFCVPFFIGCQDFFKGRLNSSYRKNLEVLAGFEKVRENFRESFRGIGGGRFQFFRPNSYDIPVPAPLPELSSLGVATS